MRTPNFTKQALALGLALCFTAAGVAIAAECSMGTDGNKLPGMFSVLEGGSITYGGGACNAVYYDTPTLGVTTEKLVLPEVGKCTSYSYDSTGASSQKKTDVTASRSTAKKRTLDTYVPSTADTKQIYHYEPNGVTLETVIDASKYQSSWSALSTKPSSVFKTPGGESISQYTLPGGEYNEIQTANGASLVFTGPVKIHKLGLIGCKEGSGKGGVTFADSSVNYIDKFTTSNGCDIAVATGSGTAVLNILGTDASNWDSTTNSLKNASATIYGVKIEQKLCVNIDISTDPSACKNLYDTDWLAKDLYRTYALMNSQHPERFQINVYNGDFKMAGVSAMALGIYVDKGKADLKTATPSVLIGDMLASSIDGQNNAGNYYLYKASSMDGNKTTVKAGYVYSNYSLAMTAVTPTMHVDNCQATVSSNVIQTTDGYAYIATQRDGTTASDGTQKAGISGDLVAYHILSDGTYGTQAWSAATKLAAMKSGGITVNGELRTDTWRKAHMYTNDNTTNITTIAGSSWAKPYVERILNPSAEELGSLASDSVFGRPWRTAPVIFGKSVIFATEDGFLYSIDRDTGGFNWGWMPYDIGQKIQPISSTATAAAKLAAADAVMNAHPWGQISTVEIDGKYYITGSALGGALHFSIQTNANGDALVTSGGIAFYDYRAGKNSPGGAYADIAAGVPTTGWPFGGAAPTEAISQDNAGKVAYVVDHKLVVRNADGTGTTSEHSLDTVLGISDKESSNLIYWSDSSIMVGSTGRKLYEMTAEGEKVTGLDDIDLKLPSGEPVFGLNGSFISSATANAKIVEAQAKTQVTAVKYDGVGGNPSWSYLWYARAGGSDSADSNVTVPVIPSTASITALPAILPPTKSYMETTLIPYTKPETLDVKCIADSDAATTGAYSFGPLLLATGKSALDGSMMGSSSRSALSVRTGDGEATGITVVTYVVEGSCGATGTFVAAQAAASGRPKSFYDYGTSASSANASKPSGNETHFEATGTAKTRLNWRELTNFF